MIDSGILDDYNLIEIILYMFWANTDSAQEPLFKSSKANVNELMICMMFCITYIFLSAYPYKYCLTFRHPLSAQ